jgi:predicted HTH transcriptional regulator
MNIATLIAHPEGKTLEFKRDLSSPRNILRTVCAFSNSAGGTLVIGVADADRSVVGIEDAIDAETRLANIISDGVAPRLVPGIDAVRIGGATVLVVTLDLGPLRPYHIVQDGPQQGVFVRVGSTNRHVDDAYIRELARSAQGQPFDEQPMRDQTAANLDLDRIRSLFAGVRSVGTRELRSLHLLTDDADRDAATVGGALLFGKQRDSDFPDASIRCARFKGVTRGTFLDSQDLSGCLPDQVDAAMAFVQRNTTRRLEPSGLRNETWWEYPLPAIREAVCNAVVHADYSQSGSPLRVAIYDDRIEIENPGLLVPGVTIESMLEGRSRLRNRVIARVFRELGLIEDWGNGVRRMIDGCRSAGLPDPLFEEAGLAFRVTIFNSRDHEPPLDPVDSAITKLLRESDGLSTGELAEMVGRTPRAMRTRIKRLLESGILTQLGTGPNDPNKKYFLAEDRAPYWTRPGAFPPDGD